MLKSDYVFGEIWGGLKAAEEVDGEEEEEDNDEEKDEDDEEDEEEKAEVSTW